MAEHSCVTVVVATHNRSARLERLMGALEAQVDAPPFDVVVVDDGSEDDTPAVLADLARRASIPVRVHRLEENGGPARARNVGWRSSDAPIIAFTDDDCAPDPRWLALLVEGLDGADIAQGATWLDRDQPMTGLFQYTLEITSESGHYETCNIAYRREVLERVDGFDERFRMRAPRRAGRYRPPVWGEDVDLALRAKAAGARSAFVPTALVWHATKPGTLRARLSDVPRRAGVVELVRRHPQMRDDYIWRVFVDPAHPRFLLAVAGLVPLALAPGQPARWVAAFVAALPWLDHRRRMHRRRDLPRALPGWFVVDAAEVAVLARAAVRARIPIL